MDARACRPGRTRRRDRGARRHARERRAVRLYQSLHGHGTRLNALLAGEPVPASEGTERRWMTRRLDGLLRRAVLPVDLTLYRGVSGGARFPALETLPVLWSLGEFVSASLSPQVAAEIADGGVVLRLLARKRTPGLWLPPLGYRTLAYEEEVLLPRGSFYALHAWGRVDGVVQVFGEVV